MNYLLDTNICIALLKGTDPVLAKNIASHQPHDFALCSVVKAELIFGARNSQKVEANLTLLHHFFDSFTSLPFDDSSAEHYGVIRTTLSRQGTPIGANDLLIASIALAHNLAVITRNRNEFLRVPALRVEMW